MLHELQEALIDWAKLSPEAQELIKITLVNWCHTQNANHRYVDNRCNLLNALPDVPCHYLTNKHCNYDSQKHKEIQVLHAVA